MNLELKFVINAEPICLQVPASEEDLCFNLSNNDAFTIDYIKNLHQVGGLPNIATIDYIFRSDDNDERLLLYSSTEQLGENSAPLQELDVGDTDDRTYWTNEDILALITSYDNNKENFNSAKKRKIVWELISTELSTLGVKKSSKLCEIKWRNLLRTYKAIKDNKNKTGRGASRFPYYDRLDDILGSKPSTSSPHTVSVGVENPTPSATQILQNAKPQIQEPPMQVRSPNKKYVSPLQTYMKKRNELQERKMKIWETEIKDRGNRKKQKLEILQKKNEIEERKLLAFESYVRILNQGSGNTNNE